MRRRVVAKTLACLAVVASAALLMAQVGTPPGITGSPAQIQAVAGTAASPGVNLGNNTGLFRVGNGLHFAVAGTDRMTLGVSTGNDLELRSDGELRFSTTTDPSAGSDAILSRVAAGVLGSKGAAGTAYWFQSTAGRFTLSSDFTNATGTLSTLGFATVNLQSGRKYAFRMTLFASETTAADGIKLDWNGGGTATISAFLASCVLTNDTGGNVAQVNSTSAAIGTLISATALSTTNVHLYECSGYITVSGTGTLVTRAAQNAHTTGTLTVKTGSWLWLEDTP